MRRRSAQSRSNACQKRARMSSVSIMISCLASAMVTCSAWRRRAGDRAVACRIDDLVLAGGHQQDRQVDALEIARHQRGRHRARGLAGPADGRAAQRQARVGGEPVLGEAVAPLVMGDVVGGEVAGQEHEGAGAEQVAMVDRRDLGHQHQHRAQEGLALQAGHRRDDRRRPASGAGPCSARCAQQDMAAHRMAERQDRPRGMRAPRSCRGTVSGRRCRSRSCRYGRRRARPAGGRSSPGRASPARATAKPRCSNSPTTSVAYFSMNSPRPVSRTTVPRGRSGGVPAGIAQPCVSRTATSRNGRPAR